MIGRTISHYRITDKLGEGGMGKVYLAEDTSLNRKVALKFLPERLQQEDLARKRFLREAESAAALEHPYICNIKEVAHTRDALDFIVMEYVEGETLKDRLEKGQLSVSESLKIASEVAEALEMAHQKGIIHRDLKPANIMLTPQGHAKVMDFGLAKRLGVAGGTDQDLTAGLTQEDSTLGTPAYMSPEQVKAEPLDHRTDLYSFGILFYEMLSGIHPFRRAGPIETMGAILPEEPEPLAKRVEQTTDLLQQTVTRLLAKDPDDRIQTSGELSIRLGQISGQQDSLRLMTLLHSRQGRRLLLALAAVVAVVLTGWWVFKNNSTRFGGPLVASIVVLPLADLSGDPEQAYFADGMTEALITDLSKIGALKVISRSSAMRYRNTEKSLAEIGRELNVEAVLEGSVQREADQVRVNAQLIEVATQRNLWAERYERSLTSIMALQGEVAQAIAREIQVTLTPSEENLLTRRRQVNPEAYEAYLKGQFHWYKLTPEDVDTAQQYYELALQKDPGYAPAYAGIAGVWGARTYMGLTTREVMPKRLEASSKCIELDTTEPACHEALAGTATWLEWDWEKAEREFRLTIQLDPNNARARVFYGLYLTAMERSAEAISQIVRAGDNEQALDWLETAYAERMQDMVYLRVSPKWDPLRSEPRFQSLVRRMNYPD